MASRRNGNSGLEIDRRNSEKSDDKEKSSLAPAVPLSVIVKLLGFTIAMFAGPIGVYFLTLHTLYHGNSTWAGATAAFTANLVLIAYVYVAMMEDESEKVLAARKAKKGL